MNGKREKVIKKLEEFKQNKNVATVSSKSNSTLKDDSPGIHFRGYLPHFDFEGLYQNITYRLKDSLPKNVIEKILNETEDVSKQRKVIEEYLDNGIGSCLLKLPNIANMIIENWQHFDQKRYDLIAFVIMPNHVHILIKIYKNFSLSNIVHSWKSYTSKKIKEILMNDEKIKNEKPITFEIGWQEDYWDRFVRDEAHFFQAIEYIHQNPVKAGLCIKPEDWEFSSYVEYHRKKLKK